MEKFEYKIIAPDLGEDIDRSEFANELDASKLNALGKDGWELVSVIPQDQFNDKTNYLSLDPLAELVFVFKRKVKN